MFSFIYNLLFGDLKGKTLLGVSLQTVFEYIGLIFWLAFALGEIGSNPLIGIVILVAGFLIEHFVAFAILKGKPLPVLQLIGISLSETVLWIVWLILYQMFGIVVSLLFLFVTMIFQHSIEKNVFDRVPLFDNLPNPKVVFHTFTEVSVAQAWLISVDLFGPLSVEGIIGAVILIVGLFVEHFIAANLKPEKKRVVKKSEGVDMIGK